MTNELPPRMDLSSLDVAADKRELLRRCLAATFPEIMAEDKIDLDQLRRVLGEWVEPDRERFGLNWPGKAACMKVIQAPSVGTLKPCRAESVDWDSTGNVFIEGDNLEVLKLLQKAYFGKVKMIYIDPPYNTGKEFVYPDKFAETLDTYLEYSGQKDGEGNPFATNREESGRYHSRWLSMMYPRLYLAKNLLQDDGVIFISIDDHEDSNLERICDEIFGEENCLAKFSWRTDGNFDNQAKVKRCHEYVLCYCRDVEKFPHPPVIDPSVPPDSKLYRPEIRNTIVKNGPKNPVSTVTLPAGFPADFAEGCIQKRKDAWPEYLDDAVIQNGKLSKAVTVSSGWSSKDLLVDYINNGFSPILDQKGQETRFVVTRTGAIEAIKTRTQQSHVISTLANFGGPQRATSQLEAISIPFDDYPKPVDLIKYFIQMNEGRDFIVMDFFAGSGTTGHAVLDVNSQDGGSRKFVLVQLPEPTGRSDYKTISEIGQARLKKAGAQYRKDVGTLLADNLKVDFGFRAFKLDRSNFRSWDGAVADDGQLEAQLELHIEHVTAESSAEDILYELLLKDGFPLATPIEKLTVAGKEVFSIAGGALLICLDKALTQEVIDAMAEREPHRVICLDAGFQGNDQLKANAVQTFKARARNSETAIEFRTV